MLRRCRRLHSTHVQVSRPASTVRVHVNRATSTSSGPGTAPHVAQTGSGCERRGASAAGSAIGQPFAAAAFAFAAAFAAFLTSRTFWRDSGSVTSATERNEPVSA